MTASLPLVERKRRQARQRILRAADELFAARGFDKVSVSDIAERAEVGRTTFFRYFGDKQEVVFAKQQQLLDTIAAARDHEVAVAQTATEAVEQLRPIVLDLCAQVTTDAGAYARHYALLEQHPELQARDALKMQQIADTLNDLLVHRGCDPAIARLGAEIALACYRTPLGLGNNPATLLDGAQTAFDRALSLGTDFAET